jgi:PadR family transcriptional regulator, regulatory protein PadR
MKDTHRKYLQREILLSFWKLHILHHAGEQPLLGRGILEELRRHGYAVSPGTLYPMLHRMEELGLLLGSTGERSGSRAPRWYTLTDEGRALLNAAREQLRELTGEIDSAPSSGGKRRAATA